MSGVAESWMAGSEPGHGESGGGVHRDAPAHESRAGELWFDLYREEAGQRRLREALKLANDAQRCALIDLGCTLAHVDWGSGIACEAVILPVGRVADLDRRVPEECTRTLSVMGLAGPLDGPEHVLDVLALPLDGSRALSLHGSAAVGRFAVAEDGVCRLLTSGLAFLRRHLLRVDALRGEAPDHLAHVFAGPPDRAETLILDRSAFEWRLSEPGCVVPRAADLRLACPDSRELAVWLAREMRARQPVRRAPEILAPKTGASDPPFVAPSRDTSPTRGAERWR